MSDAERTGNNWAVENQEKLERQADPMTKPSVEQPEAPTPGGEDEQSIQLEPPLINPSEKDEK